MKEPDENGFTEDIDLTPIKVNVAICDVPLSEKETSRSIFGVLVSLNIGCKVFASYIS
jgi:hypothetical protein